LLLEITRFLEKRPKIRTNLRQCTKNPQNNWKKCCFRQNIAQKSYITQHLCGKWWCNTEMDVFFTNETALEFWRLHRRSQENRDYSPCRRRLPCEASASYTVCLGEAWGLSLPLDIMVGDRNARRPSKAVRPHVCSKPVPSGAFVSVGDSLYLNSPEFCFFQMAAIYPLAKLIALGFEVCGSYSLPGNVLEGGDRGDSIQTIYDLPPLTSTKKLIAFSSRMEGWIGHNQALKALRFITDNSASPMETVLAMLLTLPYRLGGYGLPMPELNGSIYPKKNVSHFAGKGFYRGDLLWRDAGVVAEYNSDAEHASSNRIAMDAIRRNDLSLCGIFEVTVTKRQIKSIELFDKVAKQIAARIGKELRYKEPEFLKARRELRSILLKA